MEGRERMEREESRGMKESRGEEGRKEWTEIMKARKIGDWR